MRLSLLALALLCAVAGCRPDVEVPAAAPGRGGMALRGWGPPPEPVRVETFPAPDGRAVLLHVEHTGMEAAAPDRVLLAAGGDTTEVFSWDFGRPLGVEWVTSDLGRIWLGVGGNFHHASVFVAASSRRVSPVLDDDAAVDARAGTVVTYDTDRFTLRDLWTGHARAVWTPPDLDLPTLWETCETVATLDGRTSTLRYDCGEGVQTRAMGWAATLPDTAP